jgi:hypothetical protein
MYKPVTAIGPSVFNPSDDVSTEAVALGTVVASSADGVVFGVFSVASAVDEYPELSTFGGITFSSLSSP